MSRLSRQKVFQEWHEGISVDKATSEPERRSLKAQGPEDNPSCARVRPAGCPPLLGGLSHKHWLASCLLQIKRLHHLLLNTSCSSFPTLNASLFIIHWSILLIPAAPVTPATHRPAWIAFGLLSNASAQSWGTPRFLWTKKASTWVIFLLPG